ncbi:DUF5133 domain-containing protein [Streptomyces rhizosphaerihabitans]|uniref:DUF5133 domain-containing protein n=1 Tax=Streptomyces rhizosphaerihabitans TaxID=1266770 RepID=UPI0028F720F9|nr:DUF5133 domain-containing protein [Streptomyces rhizosphaerihabitans]
MLMPLPVTLYQLVAEYESLLAEESPDGATPPSQRLRDLAYTLCVSTGTREVTDALDTARSYLAKAAATPRHKLPGRHETPTNHLPWGSREGEGGADWERRIPEPCHPRRVEHRGPGGTVRR